MKILEEFAIDFIKNHFDEIDLKKVGWRVKSKDGAIRGIKKSTKTLNWVIIELMTWGTGFNYIKEFTIPNDAEYFIIKVKDKYFSLDYNNGYFFKEVHTI